jgi:hypothetical protein
VLPQTIAIGNIHSGHHRREVERRDAGDDAERLPERVGVDAGAHVLGELALQELGCAARVLDDVDAARKLAGRIRQHLAVLARDDCHDLVGALLEQRLETEHDARSGQRRRGGPTGKGGFGGIDRAPDLGGGRKRNARSERTGRRCVDVAKAARCSGCALAADPMGERGDIGLAQSGSRGHRGISGIVRRTASAGAPVRAPASQFSAFAEGQSCGRR